MRKGLFECPKCGETLYTDSEKPDPQVCPSTPNVSLTCRKCGTKVELVISPTTKGCDKALRITLISVALLGALGGAMLIHGWNIIATLFLIGGLIYLIEKVFKSKHQLSLKLKPVKTEQGAAQEAHPVKDSFEELVREAVDELPQQFKEKLENTIIVVEDTPDKTIIEKLSLPSKRVLSGLYQGVPLTRRSVLYGGVLPDKITIYRKNIEASCRSREEIKKNVQRVVRHEIAHHFGFSEKQIKDLGY